MKISYDPEVDVLRILFRDVPIEESDEDKPGVIRLRQGRQRGRHGSAQRLAARITTPDPASIAGTRSLRDYETPIRDAFQRIIAQILH